MASLIQVGGLATIKVDTASSNALEIIGTTRNGAEITFEGFFLDVPGDENGGDDGPPIDVQYLGETARIRLELTKWDTAVADKVSHREYGGSVGVVPTAGNLQFQGSKSFRLTVNTTSVAYNFPRAIMRMPIELNRGTKFSTLVLEFEAHKDANGVLWNNDVTDP